MEKEKYNLIKGQKTQINIYKESKTDLDLKRINNNVIRSQIVWIIRLIRNGTKGCNNLGSGLEAPEKGRDEDTMDRKPELAPEPPTRAKCPDPTVFL